MKKKKKRDEMPQNFTLFCQEKYILIKGKVCRVVSKNRI